MQLKKTTINQEEISSEEKVIKPEPEIYQRLFDKFNLKPEECIFADDRAENIEGGRRLGLDGIVFKDAKQYERELREYLAFHQDTIVTERLLLRRWKPSMTQDLTTYFVWIGGSCDYGHNFCTFAALNRSGILLDYCLVYFCVIIYKLTIA